MADFDDDFGDLYADVEAQANSAISSMLDSAPLGVAEPEEGDKFSVEIVDDGSDSEDDLNIVLNDNDDSKLWAGGGGSFNVDEDQKQDDNFVLTDGNGLSWNTTNQDDHLGEGSEPNCHFQIANDKRNGVKGNSNQQQYKYMRHHALIPNNIIPNGSMGITNFPPMSTRADWEGNGYKLQQVSTSTQVSCTYAKANTVVAQSGCGFWLPWYRTILDLNINVFEEKPWRYPGVDITDFFNFGLNEDSWKQYCNSLEHLRQQSSLRTRIPGYESFKFNQAYGAGSMHEKVVQEGWSKDPQVGPGRVVSALKSSNGKGRTSELPKGRAIQVEEGSGERHPSMDMRRPISWYSDVVIEINVQDSAEEASDSSNREPGHTDNKEQEKAENRDLDVNCEKEIHHCDSYGGDVHSIESGEGNVTRLDRCIQLMTAPTLVSSDSDNHGNGCVSGVDIHNRAKRDACTSSGIAETMEIEKNTNDEVCGDTCDAYPCLLEAALSLEDQSLPSPTLSSIGSDSSEGYVKGNPGIINNPLSRPPSDSGTEFPDSVASDYNTPKRNRGKMSSGDRKDYYSRNKKPVRQERNNFSGRLPHCAELKVQTENDDESIPVSDTGAFLDRKNKSFDCMGQKEGVHKFDYDDIQDFSCYRETELSCEYGSEKFTKDHVHAVNTNYPHRIGCQSSSEKMDPYLEKDWGEVSHEQKNARQDDEDIENDWLCGGRGFSTGDMSSITYRGSRWAVSKHSSSVKQRNITWRRKTVKHQYREKASAPGGQPCDYKAENDYIRRRYERCLQSSGRGLQNLGGRGRYRNIPPFDLGCSPTTEYGNEHWGLSEYQSLSSHSYRKTHLAGGRWHHNRLPKHDVYDSRSIESSGGFRRQICAEDRREIDWHVSYNDSHPDDRLHLGRGTYTCHSKVLDWSDDNIISRQQDGDLYSKGSLILHDKNSRHGKIRAQSGTLCDGILIDDVQLEQHKYGNIREGNNANCSSRSSSTKYRDKHKQPAQMCRDSVALAVGDGKHSRRYSNGRSLTCNDGLGMQDWNEQASPKDSGVFHKMQGKSISNRDNKWFDEFVVTKQNQDLDIEEGQIVSEEAVKSVEEKHVVPEGEALMKSRIWSCESGSEAVSEQRILETLAKMEKRRARFNKPISGKKEVDDDIPNPKGELMGNEESKQQRPRPARKRRWGGR